MVPRPAGASGPGPHAAQQCPSCGDSAAGDGRPAQRAAHGGDGPRGCSHLPGRPLEGKPLEALWDASLRAAMEQRGRALHEEQLIETLLEDLRGSVGRA
ncbi:DUF2399 domain-containing protein [Halomonas mongoliensis]|uniref:DUF2399 domain-containing protein n=1 Tax=Halomonas mongoliensis TaxID=321265 RepID=UPI0035B545F2